MKKVIRPNDSDTITIKSVKDNFRVGIQLGEEKYMVVSKRDAMENVVYSRMNDNSFVLAEEYNSVHSLIEFFSMAQAFVFENQKEAFTWFLE